MPYLPLYPKYLLDMHFIIQELFDIFFEPVQQWLEILFAMSVVVVENLVDVVSYPLYYRSGYDEPFVDIRHTLPDSQIPTDELLFGVEAPTIVGMIVEEVNSNPSFCDKVQKLGIETHLIHTV